MRASCSPQSELGSALMGLAPACALAAHCTDHCSMSVAQGIRGPCGFGVILTFLPENWAVPRDTYNTRQGLRSLPHLREHFKTRADDNHAAPVQTSLRDDHPFGRSSSGFQALVRFLAYRRIKPHAPPLVRVPVYSFEF